MSLNRKDTHGYKAYQNEEILFKNFNGSGFSEAFKASNCKGISVYSCNFNGGKEDCFDAVRAEVKVFDSSFEPEEETKQTITAKGGSDVLIDFCDFKSGPMFDIVVGDFTIYDGVCKMPPSRVTLINSQASNKKGANKHIKVLVLHGSCEHRGSAIKVFKVPSLVVKVYFWIMSRLMTKARREEAIFNLLDGAE
jgi:hypothetical protein